MATRKKLKEVLDCECNECSHSWVTQNDEMPQTCPSCGSVEWNTVWRKTGESKNNHADLSNYEKEKLERQMINESWVRQAELRGRKRIIPARTE